LYYVFVVRFLYRLSGISLRHLSVHLYTAIILINVNRRTLWC